MLSYTGMAGKLSCDVRSFFVMYQSERSEESRHKNITYRIEDSIRWINLFFIVSMIFLGFPRSGNRDFQVLNWKLSS